MRGDEHREVQAAGDADDGRTERQVGGPGQYRAEGGREGGEDGGEGGALFRGFGEAVGGVGRDDEQGDDKQQAEVLHGGADKEADEQQEGEVVVARMWVFGAGNGRADGHEDERLPQAVEQGATDEGNKGDVDKIARAGGEDVAEEVVDEVGADVFHGRKQDHAEGEGDVRQAAEDVAGVFPPVFFDEVEQGDEQQGDAPDADDWRQTAFQGQRDAEQGGVRQRFAEVNETAPGDKRADGGRDDAGDEGAEPGDEDEVQDHGQRWLWS